ncbi:sensor histidine kinase [Actinomyces bowdenii]|uniref:histidine kinase n=1 Tax=Actinomyces bowdenii TaxID=131109 RepID=A0A3P1V457_9ACTO|nr:histidine kinase [Actinomyces bowdenii]RRD28891.1 histidine kinase [Actinomyces bowdenii]
MPARGQTRSAAEGTARPPVRESVPDLILVLLILWPTLANRPEPLPLLAPQAATVLYLVLMALCCGAIAARRLAPLAGVLLIGACLVVHLIAFHDLSVLMVLSGLIAVETTQSRLDPPWRWALLAGAVLGASVAILRGLYLVGGQWGRLPLLLVSTWMAVALAAFVGAWRRRGRDRFEQALERAAVLEAQQDAERRLAVAEERQRIARDVHDLLGHSLSVIAVQAEGARAVLNADPGAADRALGVIGQTARQSVDEVRALVDMLRSEGTSPSDAMAGLPGQGGGQASGRGETGSALTPAPSGTGAAGGANGAGEDDDAVEALVRLVQRARRAGLPVGLRLDTGEAGAPSIPPRAGRALERTAQESLTNALRHAPGAAVRVELVVAGDSAGLTVTNTAAGGTGEPGAGEGSRAGARNGEGPSGRTQQSGLPRGRGGFGLIAMRERVVAAGGALSAGPTPDGGWQVRARLPLAGPADPPASAEPSSSARPAAGPGRGGLIGAPA